MDQQVIGSYIATKRKEKGYTQQQLAEQLNISSKTVSKWECGNGLPEVSLMLPLCRQLGITVNELLSGEDLTSGYQAKAEENLISLVAEKEKLSLKKVILWLLLSLIVSCGIWVALFADSNVYQWGHMPTKLTLVYLIIGFLAIYLVVLISGYAVMRKNRSLLMLCVALACLGCLTVCLLFDTFWLLIPAIAGLVIVMVVSMMGLRTKKTNEKESNN